MQIDCSLRNGALLPVLVSALLSYFAGTNLAHAQTTQAESVVVSAQDLPSAYGAPSAFSQSRFSPLTNAYVLPPGTVYTSLIYEGDAVHYRPPDHHFTQECEIGLPYRINVAIENDVQRFDGDLQESTFSLEARYALADWNKIPLNPTLFAECKFGIGNILHDEGAPTPAKRFGPGGFDKSADIPTSYEVRLLLSEDFFDRIEWAANVFFEQETGGDRGREWGIANSIVTPIHLFGESPTPSHSDDKSVHPTSSETNYEVLKAGLEFQFRSFSDSSSRGTPYNSFVIGPTIAWKPTRSFRLDVSPLFGVNHKSPIAQVFVVASYFWGSGGGSEAGGEAPASTRNR
jgi:hypothetical protein